MNTTTRALIRQGSTLAAAVFGALLVLVAVAEPAHAATIDLGQEISLPVGWGPAIVGLIIAGLTNLSTRIDARPWIKVAVAITLSVVAALAQNLADVGWTFVPADLGKLFLTAWLWQLAMHFGLVKPVAQRYLAPDKGLS